jgi:uncharacterized protein YbcI
VAGSNPNLIEGADRPTGGELNAALTREIVRIHTANLGRGPKKSFAFHNGAVVVVVLEDVMTRAEQSLAANGEGEAVLSMRHLLQRTGDEGQRRASHQAPSGGVHER